MRDDTEYLFIDGANLRERVNRTMETIFGASAELELNKVKQTFRAYKAFYYDCLYDVQRKSEPDVDFRARVAQQQAFFDRIQALPGFHVRLGTLAGTKPDRLRQKEVDVQLSVDMLWHAFQSNTKRVTLVSGDLDFRPVVTTLVQMGAWVRVAGARDAGSKELFAAADETVELTAEVLHGWMPPAFQRRFVLPSINGAALTAEKERWTIHSVVATDNNGPVTIYDRLDGVFQGFVDCERLGKVSFTHASPDVVQGFAKVI